MHNLAPVTGGLMQPVSRRALLTLVRAPTCSLGRARAGRERTRVPWRERSRTGKLAP